MASPDDMFDKWRERDANRGTSKEPNPVSSRAEILRRADEQSGTEYRPRTNMPYSRPTSGPNLGMGEAVGNWFQNQTAKTMDRLKVMAGPVLMGAADDIAGGVEAGRNLIGLGEEGEGVSDAYSRGVNEAEIGTALARDRLAEGDYVPPVAWEILGSMHPKSGPGLLSRAMGSNAVRTGTLGSRVKEIGRQTGIGGAEALITSMMEGNLVDFDPAQLATDFTEGSVSGGAMQAVFGELVPLIGKKVLMGAEDKVSRELFNTGPTTEGNTASNLRGELDRLASDPNASVFDIDIGAERNELANRLTHTLLRSNFAPNDPAVGGARQMDLDRYTESVGTARRLGIEAQQRIQQNIANSLSPPTSTYARYQQQNIKLEKYRKQYALLSDTTKPGKNGAIPVRFNNVTDSLSSRIAKASNKGDISQVDEATAAAWNKALHYLRPKEQHPNAKSLYRPESGKDNVPGEINLNRATIPLAQLLDARKQIANLAKPGIMVEGSTVDKMSARAAMTVVKALDEEIAARSPFVKGSPKFKTLQSEFANVMQVDDAYEMGITFAAKRGVEDPEYGRELKEYMDALSGNKLALDAFREGYKGKLVKNIETNGLLPEVKALTGYDSKTMPGKDLMERSANVENLRTILGKDQADKFLNSLYDGMSDRMYAERLKEALEMKGYDSRAIEDTVREGDALLMYGGFTPGQNSVFANATLGAVQRYMASMGPKEAGILQDLINARGPTAASELERLIRARETPSEFPFMGQVGAVAGVDTEIDAERNAETNRYSFEELFGPLER